jgi:hypothetical protein
MCNTGLPSRYDAQTIDHYLTFYRRSVICFIYGISPYRAVNTFQHGYKNQSVNDV